MILGGGINGAALARELLLNSRSVMLVDLADVASGATASSSRLIHGGLRYLEYGEFSLVRESLAERERLLQLAPQFVHPLRLHIPIETRFEGLVASAKKFIGLKLRNSSTKPPVSRGLYLVRWGLWLYDRYARSSTLPRRSVTRVDQRGAAKVDRQRFRWLCAYSDAQIAYPERFVVALLDDARRLAADRQVSFEVFTYHRARLSGTSVVIEPVDSASGNYSSSHLEIEPAAIINATGAWVDLTLERLRVEAPRLMGGTKGSHFVTTNPALRDLLQGDGIYAEAADGRPFFILPWEDATLVGTTDLPFDGRPDEAQATEGELTYLLAGVNRVFPQLTLSRDDIDLYYCGVRPLPFMGAKTPASVTRRHWLVEHSGSKVPLYSIIGGKLTTCRSLAEEATAKILEPLGQAPLANSRERPLPGGEGYPTDEAALSAEQFRIAQTSGCASEQVAAIWRLCGTLTSTVLGASSDTEYASDDRESVVGTDLPKRFVRHVIRHEWVRKLADLVERRLMLLYHRRLHIDTLRDLARLLAEEEIISTGEMEAEVRACVTRLNAKYGKQVLAADNSHLVRHE